MQKNSILRDNLLKYIKNNRNQKLFIVSAAGATLVASGSGGDNAGGSQTGADAGTTYGDVQGAASKGNDTLIVNGGAGIINGGDGDDTIKGHASSDYFRGGVGKDNIEGGAALDHFIAIGTNQNGTYTNEDIKNPNGTGFDLRTLITLADVNSHAVSDVEVGDIFDGGADGANLYVYGNVDFTGVTLKNITRIDVHSEVTISATQLKALIDSGIFEEFIGDGTSKLVITHNGTEIELDFSAVSLQNVSAIDVASNVTLKLDQADLTGTSAITGAGSLTAVTGFLNVEGITIASDVNVASDTTNPLTNPGTNPGTNPVTNPGTIPDTDAITKIGTEFLVNSETSSSQRISDVAPLHDGGFAIIWESLDGLDEDKNSNAIKMQYFGANGSPIGNEILVNSVYDNSQNNPKIATLNNGNLIAVWTSNDGLSDDKDSYAVKAQILSQTGAKVGDEFLINSVYKSSQSSPEVIGLKNGGFAATWTSYDELGADTDRGSIKAQIFTENGTKVGTEILVNSRYKDDQVTADITALDNGGFAIIWQSEDEFEPLSDAFEIFARSYSETGVPVYLNRRVNSEMDNYQTEAAITTLENGNLAALWSSNTFGGVDRSSTSIQLRILNYKVETESKELTANTVVTDAQNNPDLVGIDGGGFLAVWTSFDRSGADISASSIKAQIFDADGKTVGEEFLVNSQYIDRQYVPSVTKLSNGNVVITWTDNSGDASGAGIKAQILQINSVTPAAKMAAHLSFDFDALNSQDQPSFDAAYIMPEIEFETPEPYIVPDHYDLG